jgi:hypothetical protein
LPPICPQARKYLDFLAAHPHLTRIEAEKAIGSGKGAAERWSKTYGAEFRSEEATIRARWKVAEAKRKHAAKLIAEGKLPAPGQPRPETDSLDPRLAVFLEHYAALGNRTKALQRCREEGVSLQLEDVQLASRTDPVFHERYAALFERVLVEIEDSQIDKGREGKTQSALAVLKAHKPQKYGNRMKITVEGGLQLSVGDRADVEAKKAGAVRKWRQRAAASAAALPGARQAEDIIDGQLVEQLTDVVAREGVN